jgi:radical SAM superfamily enzyme YgiQ (UPF0313 family)
MDSAKPPPPQVRSGARAARRATCRPMPDIVLSTLNAKFIHAAFGLRYLLANLGELQPRACLVEFDINQRPLDIAEVLLAREPKIVGLGVYIWNVAETTELVAALKRLRPDLTIILGGPEVSYETEQQEIVRLADYVITGEADLKFAEVCRVLLGDPSPSAHESASLPAPSQHPDEPEPLLSPSLSSISNGGEGGRRPGEEVPGVQRARPNRNRPVTKIIPAPLPEMTRLRLPYELYTEEDLAHRVLYVEASRGCPFTCEFCLSSLDVPVRAVELDAFLAALDRLLARGAKQFKFVDRTFNLNLNTGRAILEFLLARFEPGMFFHFEMVPDRLPEGLRELVKRFPPGALQFEVGIQTFNEDVASLISRRQNYERLADNLRFLRAETGVHVHADLIAGLPGESLASFGAGFDRLIALGPQEIQVGILKRLRGTPIVRHDVEWAMTYAAHPPYEILQTRLIPFADLQRLRRFARYWDLVGNSGNFVETTPLLWHACGSPFTGFMKWSDWLFAQTRRTHGVALMRLMELLLEFLTTEAGVETATAQRALLNDYRRGGHGDTPKFLIGAATPELAEAPKQKLPTAKRQQRHLAK